MHVSAVLPTEVENLLRTSQEVEELSRLTRPERFVLRVRDQERSADPSGYVPKVVLPNGREDLVRIGDAVGTGSKSERACHEGIGRYFGHDLVEDVFLSGLQELD